MILVSLQDYLFDLEQELYSQKITFLEYLKLSNISDKYICNNTHFFIPSNRSWIYWRMMNRNKRLIDDPRLFILKKNNFLKVKSKLNVMSR